MIPLMLASVTGATVAYVFTGYNVEFSFSASELFTASRIPFVVLLGIFTGLISVYFNKAMEMMERMFRHRLKNSWARFMVGALILSSLIFLFPALYGEGYDAINGLLAGDISVVFDNSIFYDKRNSVLWASMLVGMLCLMKVFATSATNGDYYPGGDAANDLLGANDSADWGRFNAIAAGGDEVGKWRTLTSSEWNYLFGSSSARQGKCGKAVIDGTYNGVVLLPDNWVLPSGLTFAPGISSDFTANAYTAAQWTAMEDAGAVFIPAAGFRDGTTVSNVGTHGYYWSATHINGTYAYALYFFSGYANAADLGARALGRSVRLVIDK